MGVCAVIGGLSIWIWFEGGHRLDTLNAFWGVIAGVIALITALVAWASSKSRDSQRSASADQILAELAEAVAVQWREEAETRGLFRPHALPVTWQATVASMTDRSARTAVDMAGESLGGGTTGNRSVVNHPVLADALESLPQRRLAILGGAGAGKTVLLVQLILELLDRRQAGEPVPVMFPVASWNPRTQHLHIWMAGWLEETYPSLGSLPPVAGVPFALWLVKTKQVMPLLDGLDEMAEDLRPAAIHALNRATAAVPPTDKDPLVLTCRTAEYARLLKDLPAGEQGSDAWPVGEPLAGAAVVELCPLKAGDVANYLIEATSERQLAKWNPVKEKLSNEPAGQLAQALSTPLMTAMARIAFSDTSRDPSELLGGDFAERGRIEQFLLAQLIPSVYSDMPDPLRSIRWDSSEAVGWYCFIARYLKRRRTRDLAWWELGRVIPTPVYWLLFGVSTGLASGVAFDILAGLGAAVLVGGATAVVAPLAAPIVGVSPPTNVKVRLKAGVPRFAIGFAIGLLVGIILECLLGLPFITAVTAGSMVGSAGGLASGLEFLLEQPADTTKATNPHSLLASDRTAFLVRVLGIGPAGGLAVSLAIGLESGLGAGRGIRVGIVVALALGLGISVVGTLRTVLLVGITAGIILGGLGGLFAGLVVSESHDANALLAVTCGAWLWVEIALGLAFTSAWGSYLLGRAWAAICGGLPWPLMAFLADGHRRGVLRQTGAVYQFRHAALQDHLFEKGQSVRQRGKIRHRSFAIRVRYRLHSKL